jgi:hypothetical protein
MMTVCKGRDKRGRGVLELYSARRSPYILVGGDHDVDEEDLACRQKVVVMDQAGMRCGVIRIVTTFKIDVHIGK